ncbi:MAG: AAA family ATPase [Nanoarchaeota archaeon]
MWEDTTKKEIGKDFRPEQQSKPSMLPTMLDAEKPKETDFNNYFKQDDKPKAFVTLLFGDTASGKTFTALTFPEPIYVIDTENRAISTKYYNFKNKDIKIFEPIQLKTDFDPKDSDALDTHATINNISKFVIDFAKQVKEGKITKGTIIVDTVTDIWSLCQDWGIYELAKYTNKEGGKKADTILMRISSQFDWGIINKKHHEILGILRTLIKYGIYVVFTAREQSIPDYAKEKTATVKDKIRSQKDVPFLSDVIFNLKKVQGQNTTKYWSQCIKLSGLPTPNEFLENLNFEKISKLLEREEETK